MAGLFVYDTMTDTAGTLLTAHTGQTGATWTKTGSQTGDGQITGTGDHVRITGAVETFVKASGAPAGADYDVQADFFFPDASTYLSLSGRQNGAALNAGTGGYLAGFDPSTGLHIYNGLTILASSAYSPSAASTHVLRFSLRGTALTLYVDGVSTLTATDSTYASAGTAGLFFFATASVTDSNGPQITNYGAIDAGNLAAGILSNTSITSSGGNFAMTTPIGGVYTYTYQLQRSPHGANTWSNIGSALTAQFASATFSDSTASAGTQYDYRVVVTDSTGGTPLTANTNVVTITTSGGGGATSYTFTPPTPRMGVRGSASGNFTVTPVGGSYTGTITIAVSGAGLSSPANDVTLTFSGSAAQTFTITPPNKGVVTLIPSASPTLGTNPAALSYVSLPKVKIVFKGDSLTYGQNASSGQGTTVGPVYPGVVMTQLQGGNSFYSSVNLGIGGETLSSMLAAEAGEIQPQFDATQDYNILVIEAGINDMGGGASAASVWANMVTYVSNAQGYGFLPIIQLTTPSAYSGYVTNTNEVRDQFNDLIRSNWKSTKAVAISDIAADSRIGWSGDETNATYYNGSDLTHLTDAGYAIVAAYATQAIQSVIDGATNGSGGSGGISRSRLQ